LKPKVGITSHGGLIAAVACISMVFCGIAIPASAAASRGPAPAHASVIGGHAASIAELPSLAFIQAVEPGIGVFACTGTVVAPKVVLTAGHCVEDVESGAITAASGYAVATGIANLSGVKRTDVSQVAQAVVYPGFEPTKLRGDAGLLVLTAPVTAPALPLASAADSGLLAAGTPISISGWGLTDPKAKEAPDQLQTGSSVIQSSEYCSRQTVKYYPFYSPAQQLCAIDTPSHMVSGCFGDSGGPAMALHPDGSPVEVGIVSTGGPGCNRSLPNVFTRVDQISPWVASWIDAVEHGGPVPAIETPRAHPPLLTFEHAKELVSVGLEVDFKYRFRRASEKQIRCIRVAKEKVKCGVAWAQGGNNYFGTVTVYFAIRRNSVVWNDRYKIHWVDDRCLNSNHSQTCLIHTRAR
jgi:hypothetical protein